MRNALVSLVSFFRGKPRQSAKWDDTREQILKNIVEVASIPTKNYKEVIEVRIPTRFYWNPDGSFDGIEFGPFATTLLPWQEDMVQRCLKAVGGEETD